MDLQMNPSMNSLDASGKVRIFGGKETCWRSRLGTCAGCIFVCLMLKSEDSEVLLVVFPECVMYFDVPFLPYSWKWRLGPSNVSFLSFRLIFHFHDYGKKGSSFVIICFIVLPLYLIIPNKSAWTTTCIQCFKPLKTGLQEEEMKSDSEDDPSSAGLRVGFVLFCNVDPGFINPMVV